MTARTILVSAGEASGDRMAALALQALHGEVEAFGMGGAACEATGVELVADMRAVNAMGLARVAVKANAVRQAFRSLETTARSRRPHAALLVGNSAFNELLGRRLRSAGIPVLWCAAPQVWAWGRWRLRSMRASVDKLAVTLPFEEPLWRERGYDARYVGHPSVEVTRWDASHRDNCLAVLCGSRNQEAEGAGTVLLQAASAWVRTHHDWHADVLAAPSLSRNVLAALESMTRAGGMGWCVMDATDGAAPVLHRYRMALCVSGTATLEAALSGTPPVIAYQCDRLTALAARVLVRSPHIGLPNVVLGRRAFPELVQHALTPLAVLDAADTLVSQRATAIEACRALRDALSLGSGAGFGHRVASMLRELL